MKTGTAPWSGGGCQAAQEVCEKEAIMLTVTASAKERLRETLQLEAEPEMAIRVIPSPSEPNQLQLALDKENERDQVVQADDGMNLLLIGPDLAPALDGMVMDYKQTPEGSGFTLTESAPQAGPSKVVEVTDQSFSEEVLQSSVPTEVDFWAPWCRPCRMVSPIYDTLSEEYEGRFKFCKVNVDENQQTAAMYRVMSIPMQLFFKDGEVVDSIVGAVPESQIREMVETLL
jgi:thioredoxin 1